MSSSTAQGSGPVHGTVTVDEISGGTLTNVTIVGGSLTNVTITGGSVSNVTVIGGTISNVTITGGTLSNTTIVGGTVSNVTITGGTLTNVTVVGGTLSNVTITSITAGTNRVGGAYDVGGTIIDEAPAARAITRAFANATAASNTSVVAAQGAGVIVRVVAAFVLSGSAITVKFESATTDISAGFPLAANGGFVLPYNPHGWFQTAANEALNVNLSGAATVGVNVLWVPAA